MNSLSGNSKKFLILFVFLEMAGVAFTLNFGNQQCVNLLNEIWLGNNKFLKRWLRSQGYNNFGDMACKSICINFVVGGSKTYLFLEDRYPIGGSIPLVAFDVVHTVFQISITFCQIDLQKVAQKVPQV
jgi:hypothetical protein